MEYFGFWNWVSYTARGVGIDQSNEADSLGKSFLQLYITHKKRNICTLMSSQSGLNWQIILQFIAIPFIFRVEEIRGVVLKASGLNLES